MRLLNAKTIRLEEFFEDRVPPYAILSHTWGDEEISFQEIQGPPPSHQAGYAKITSTCQQALRDGYGYAWVDTCCIDKSSSAELSEAINSMFRWYQEARVCYAYLSDVPLVDDQDEQKAAFAKSRWFTRGWTLQELLAPKEMLFFSQDWQVLSPRSDLADTINRVTKISLTYLKGDSSRLGEASIAEKMSWAADRKTTRTEDVAYCLLGIFGVNMPLIYGEGTSAFRRLQEELIKQTDDQTIFAWTWNPSRLKRDYGVGVLAISPSDFGKCSDLVPRRPAKGATPFSVTNRGVRIELPIRTWPALGKALAVLMCGPRDDPTKLIGLPLRISEGDLLSRMSEDGLEFWNHGCGWPYEMPRSVPDTIWRSLSTQTLHLVVGEARIRSDDGSWVPRRLFIRRLPWGMRFYDPLSPTRCADWNDMTGTRNIERHPFVGCSTGILDATVLFGLTDGQRKVAILLQVYTGQVRKVIGAYYSWMVDCTVVGQETIIPGTNFYEVSYEISQEVKPTRFYRWSDKGLLYVVLEPQVLLGESILFVDVCYTSNPVLKCFVFLKSSWARYTSPTLRLLAAAAVWAYLERVKVLAGLAVFSLIISLAYVMEWVGSAGTILGAAAWGWSLSGRGRDMRPVLTAIFAVTGSQALSIVLTSWWLRFLCRLFLLFFIPSYYVYMEG